MVLFWSVVAGIATVVAAAVGMLAWLHPRTPKGAPSAAHETLVVEASNEFPVFDRPDGSRELGEHYVGITARNGTPRPVRATGFGLALPGERRMVMMAQVTSWEPALPHWITTGDHATWYLLAAEVRRQAAELGCAFDDMRAYVSFADGREVRASRGVPLA